MATTTFKPSASSHRFLPSKGQLLVILLIAGASILAAISFTTAYQNFVLLHQDMVQAKTLVSQYKDSLNNKGNNNMRLLEQSSETNKFKTQQLEERIKVLEQALKQQQQRSSYPDGKEAVKKELEAYKLQFQQKIQEYEQQIFALTQQMKNYREENQITREQQMKIRNAYQQLLNKFNEKSQGGIVSSQDDLENALESRLSQFVNADYEHEQKFKELQRAIENCAKVGELKALEVYYDDKFDSLNKVIQKNQQQKPSSVGQAKTVSENPQQIQQLKQEIFELNVEKEEIRNVLNSVLTQQRKNEERLNKVEAQGTQNTNTNKNHFATEQTEPSRKPQPVKNQKEVLKENMGRGSEEVVQNMKRRLSEMNEQQKVNSEGCNSCSGQRDQRGPNNHGFGFDQDAWMRQHMMNFGQRNMFSNFPRQRQMNNCVFC